MRMIFNINIKYLKLKKRRISMVTIIYWSGTGNTLNMAEAIKDGVEENNDEARLIEVTSATIEDVKDSNKIAFGCPAMGSEELEEEDFRPFMDEANKEIAGKKVALFGSYEWADGEWMDTWIEEIEDTGAELIEGLIAYDNPDDEDIEKCKNLGRKLAEI